MKRFLQLIANIHLKSIAVLVGSMFFVCSTAVADNYNYDDSWGKAGYTLEAQSNTGVTVNYSIHQFSLTDMAVNGESMVNLELPGNLLFNDEGAPNLPGSGRCDRRYLPSHEGPEADGAWGPIQWVRSLPTISDSAATSSRKQPTSSSRNSFRIRVSGRFLAS